MQLLPFWGGNPAVNFEVRKDFFVYVTEPRQEMMRGKISFVELTPAEDALYTYSLGSGTFFSADGASVELELQIYGHEFLNDQGVVGGLLRTSVVVRENMANVVFNFRREPGRQYGFNIQEINRRPGVISFTDRNRRFIARENLEHRLLPVFNPRRRRFDDRAPEVVELDADLAARNMDAALVEPGVVGEMNPPPAINQPQEIIPPPEINPPPEIVPPQ